MTIQSTAVRGLILMAALTASFAQAAPRSYNGVPELDVKGSCSDAQKFSSQGDDKGVAYKGCMQDETNAKNELAKRWSSFKAADKTSCVEQARAPSPSYVEVLTCLEMDTDSMNTGGRGHSPQIGGPSAPGLANPSTPAAPKT
ncbi:hypothetical protein [Beijerinckia sp. L45]|uniref:hypothetical protein n=1 Tax=Beijerinckia sp. L45 TaxID=1641855 RepID=UPI00131C092C|nr:hypothetical protein [Beijerinckia sp. L45]